MGLINKISNKIDKIKNKNYTDKLIEAVLHGKEKAVKKYLEKGANPNAKMSNGINLLIYAIRNNSLEIVKHLLNFNAEQNTENSIGEPVSALIIAIQQGREAIVKCLLDFHAVPNMKYGPQELTPLTLACYEKQFNIAKLLLEAGANANLSGCGTTPLAAAIFVDNLEIVKLLLQYNAEISKFDLSEARRRAPFVFSNQTYNYLVETVNIRAAEKRLRELQKYVGLIYLAWKDPNSVLNIFPKEILIQIAAETLSGTSKPEEKYTQAYKFFGKCDSRTIQPYVPKNESSVAKKM